MKNILTKPISSPGRIIDDQFQNMLLRSKSNRGSRSRTNPMFVGKPNTNNNNEINQEPSSPKVTCMGQVRVKRSIKRKQTKKTTPGANWLQIPRGWLRKNSVLFFRSAGCCGKSRNVQGGQNEMEINEWRVREIEDVIGNGNDVFGETERVPKNAFLLTRSRSEPFRCSAFANKIWESNIDDETGEKVGVKDEVNEGFIINGDIIGKENGEDIIVNRVEEEEEFKEKPLNLNRCKSEPARTGDKLFMSFTP
uniref:uncharacterized protein LOC122583635 n=1 Tax=Erigeron canadensis TaxID=72917 RepID=UPI001CB94E08|nr:uncharacterized protein LOC122583635 [Erigeron canadensis]